MGWRKFDETYFFNVGSQFGDFGPFSIPDVNHPIFTSRKDVPGVRGERTFDDRWFIDEVGELEELVALESVKQHYTIVGGG